MVDGRKEKLNRIRRVISELEKLEVEHPVDPRDNAFEHYDSLITRGVNRSGDTETRPITDGSANRVVG